MSTYALCGFASFASIGICIGSLRYTVTSIEKTIFIKSTTLFLFCFSALAPKRAKVFARLAGLGMIFGNITCCFTACFAGIIIRLKYLYEHTWRVSDYTFKYLLKDCFISNEHNFHFNRIHMFT